MKYRFPTWLCLLCFVLAVPALAERADRLKPMQVEADRMQHDEPRRLTISSGNVQAVKGTLVMRAARMEVQQDEQGRQQARFWAESGQRVYFRQKREGLEEFIEGEALQASYDSHQDTMTLTGQAEVRVLRQGRMADRIEGQTIRYNNSTETLQVDGQSTDKNLTGRSRVRAVLTPRDAASAPGVAPALVLQPEVRP